MHDDIEVLYDTNSDDGPYWSWFRYGWFEGKFGAYVPPRAGPLGKSLYWLGNTLSRICR